MEGSFQTDCVVFFRGEIVIEFIWGGLLRRLKQGKYSYPMKLLYASMELLHNSHISSLNLHSYDKQVNQLLLENNFCDTRLKIYF